MWRRGFTLTSNAIFSDRRGMRRSHTNDDMAGNSFRRFLRKHSVDSALILASG